MSTPYERFAAPPVADRDDPAAPPIDDRYSPFPVGALPEPLCKYVEAVAQAAGCVPSYVALPVLAVCAGAIGTTIRVSLKAGWSEPAVLWCATVGRSGTLKSPAMRHATRPLHHAQRESIGQHAEAMRAYEEARDYHELAMRRWRKDGGVADRPVPPDPPPMSRTVVSDVTIEALAPILLANARGVLLARDDLSAWIGSYDRYSRGGRGADAATWCSIYDAASIVYDRKTGDQRTIYVPRAAVSVAGTIQPGAARRLFGADLRESGLVARLMVAMPPTAPALWTEAELDEATASRYVGLVAALLAIEPGTDETGEPRPRYLPLTHDAQARYVAWHDDHARETAEAQSDDLAAALAKAKGRAARLALVQHQVRVAAGEAGARRDAIDVASVESALAISAWSIREARRVAELLGADEDGPGAGRRQLVEWIERRGGSTTVRKLMDGRRSEYPTAEAAERALAELVSDRVARWEPVEPGPRGGRPTRRCRLIDERRRTRNPSAPGKNAVSRFFAARGRPRRRPAGSRPGPARAHRGPGPRRVPAAA